MLILKGCDHSFQIFFMEKNYDSLLKREKNMRCNLYDTIKFVSTIHVFCINTKLGESKSIRCDN